MVTFGVDAHKRTHTIVAVNDRGTPVGQTTVGTTSQDHLCCCVGRPVRC
jgi:transposase